MNQLSLMYATPPGSGEEKTRAEQEHIESSLAEPTDTELQAGLNRMFAPVAEEASFPQEHFDSP